MNIENIKEEFFSRSEFVKQRIENLPNPELKSGLFKELEKLTTEFKSRGIGDNEIFLRKHFLITAEKN